MAETVHRLLNPEGVPPPFSPYSHAVEVKAPARWLHISGQVGITPDGKVPKDAQAQVRQSWLNVLAVLKGAGMGPQHLVKVTGFLLRPEDIAHFRNERDALLEGARPASSLILVAGLARNDWLVEIEAIAAA